MEEIITNDNSITFFNEEFQDHYHSRTAGALQEAFVKYVGPLQLKPGMHILDVCFGLGYNSLAVLVQEKNVYITAIEKDKAILEKIPSINVPEHQETYALIQNKKAPIKILIGDFTTVIPTLTQTFDAVLFDPFNPATCKEQWSLKVFQDLYRIMKPGALLTTYSCATWIRKNMHQAGFTVKDGPILGRKSPSTIAVKEP